MTNLIIYLVASTLLTILLVALVVISIPCLIVLISCVFFAMLYSIWRVR
jgi:hypothetical protein